ncbi:hypothetical protein MTR_0007s0290 [Medicago truncatula]|uniref:Uncharacterized protein n=1 Tax=Medicago truncatula TaxID=3880 RepID=A0A072TL32_MEDTR|nr:hypothetical protein MTR_0007s0290 [Medicago truncatula]
MGVLNRERSLLGKDQPLEMLLGLKPTRSAEFHKLVYNVRETHDLHEAYLSSQFETPNIVNPLKDDVHSSFSIGVFIYLVFHEVS